MNNIKKRQLTKLLRQYKQSLLNQTIQYKDVNREARKLGLKLQRKSDSYGYSVVISDTKSSASTRGIMRKSPQTQDFTNRLDQLKKYIGKKDVVFNDEVVKGFK